MIACPYCGHDTDFLLPSQVAQILHVPGQTVRRWLREGRFPGAERKNIRGRKVWAIPQSAVLPLLEAADATRS